MQIKPLRIKIAAALGLAAACAVAGTASWAAEPAAADARAQDVDPAALAHIRDAAMNDEWAYLRLAELTDGIGPRLSGSPQLTAAIKHVADGMRALGATVTIQPAKIPHWVRGTEAAELVDYPLRVAGVTQKLHLTALGGSAATAAGGLTARVLVLHDFAEMKSRTAEVRSAIVLFESRFDQRITDNGYAGNAYRDAGMYRFSGPSAAQELGAAAVLVRSIGGADYRLPHTGATRWKENQTPLPAAALAAEDDDLIERLAAKGPVTMKLTLTPQILPDADSANVIADWLGREKPGEYVIVSGHLDSWDLATGATDDGVGVMAAAGVIEVLKRLNLHPRRTIRFIAWTNEENGGRGGKAYYDSVASTLSSQTAAIESDEGAGRALGLVAATSKESVPLLDPVLHALSPIGATVVLPRAGGVGSDISPLQEAGVPGFAPLVDARHYFDYHHTAADTLDKVDPQNMRTQIATMAVLAFFLADTPQPLGRFKASE